MNQEIQEIERRVRPILNRYGASRSAVFGSVARGEATNKSDVDLLVELPSGSTLLDLVGLEQDLEAALGRSVDVLTYDGLHPFLKERIEREAIRF